MDNLRKALREASKEDRIAIIAMAISEDPDILEELENEGLLKDLKNKAWEKIKKHGPGIAKGLGKAAGKVALKGAEMAAGGVAGGVAGAAKGMWDATADEPKTKK